MNDYRLPIAYYSPPVPEENSFKAQYYIMFAFFLVFSLLVAACFQMYWFGIGAPLFVAAILIWSVREEKRVARYKMLRELAE